MNREKVIQQASEWDARLRSPACTEGDRSAFRDWSTSDPSHAAEYERLQAALKLLHRAYPSEPRLRAIRDRALREGRGARDRLVASLAAFLVSAIAAGAVLWSREATERPAQLAAAAPSVYETAVGQTSAISLSDGSKVTLNTQSRLEVSFSEGRRDVRLVAGEGLFEVAHDTTRPFVVSADGRTVTAVGTAFAVRVAPAQLRVTMLEGRVKVRPQTGGRSKAVEQSLVAGEQLTSDNSSGAFKVSKVDPLQQTSWREGKVIFEDTALEDALSELNRYSTVRFMVKDPALSRVRINGTFRIDRPADFVRTLATYIGAEVRESHEGMILAPRAGQRS